VLTAGTVALAGVEIEEELGLGYMELYVGSSVAEVMNDDGGRRDAAMPLQRYW
jgi:hypothetical protein